MRGGKGKLLMFLSCIFPRAAKCFLFFLSRGPYAHGRASSSSTVCAVRIFGVRTDEKEKTRERPGAVTGEKAGARHVRYGMCAESYGVRRPDGTRRFLRAEFRESDIGILSLARDAGFFTRGRRGSRGDTRSHVAFRRG